MVYGINRLGTPGQKATVAGEYRPIGMGRGGNTYIQVNNYGGGYGCYGNSRGWNCNAWANMGHHHHHHDEGESTFGKVLGWTGVGMSALGTILDWIGVGKKTSTQQQQAGGAGGTEQATGAETGTEQATGVETGTEQATGAETRTEQATGAETRTEQATGAETRTEQATGAETGTEDETGAENERAGGSTGNAHWPQVGQESNYNVTVKDTSGRTRPITGKMKVTTAGANAGDPPKNFEIKTAMGFVYKFELVKNEDGKTIYKCVSETDPNGRERQSSGQEYQCKIGADGKPEFVQDASMSGHGTSV